MKAKINSQLNTLLYASLLLAVVGCSVVENPTSAESANSSSANSPLISDNSVAVAEGFRTTTIIQGLERPWGMAWLPDSSILITERPGRLRIVRNGKLDLEPVPGVPEVFAVNHGGLLDVSLHPDFEQNRLVYFTYSQGTNQANHTRVARAIFDGSTLQNWSDIFEVNLAKPGGQHFGSRIVWLPDKTMLVAFGDGGNPPIRLNGEYIRNQAQNLDSHLGSVVRLNDDGSIPQDNPFVGDSNANSAIWSYGHRNIQGMTIDPTTNRVWSTEHGSRGGDELNLMQAGQNYGWPEVSYSDEYTGGRVAEISSRPDVPEPKVVWTPSIAPSGLAFYSSDRFSQWQGDLFAGGLVSRDVRRIDLDREGNVLGEESISIGQRVRDVRQGPDGMLYVLTDEQNGNLISIEPEE
ncbi:MAG: PQQ-dependent sugar dehydrogenase [Xenococcaceae cyanobacterium MO_188.B32]|nr:PQQ-dependent sugar dehydrogenase [Xenococcaceae cyanobacterium MO_188.B32]